MIIRFSEEFDRPIEEVFGYFQSPSDWPRLFSFGGDPRNLGDGWYEVPLRDLPFPLVAKVNILVPNQKVHWEFKGFWRGEGEVRFVDRVDGGIIVEGCENISVRWLFFLSPIVEKLFLQKPFYAIWESGWRRLRERQS